MCLDSRVHRYPLATACWGLMGVRGTGKRQGGLQTRGDGDLGQGGGHGCEGQWSEMQDGPEWAVAGRLGGQAKEWGVGPRTPM